MDTGNTSVNTLPALFKIVKYNFGWNPKHKTLDYGAGKYKQMENALKAEGVEYYCRYDKYNKKENPYSIASLLKIGFDVVIISNVLNTIPTLDEQLVCVGNAKRLLGSTGVIYATVYEGNRSGEYEITRCGFQQNLPTTAYMEVFSNFRFKFIKRHGKLIVAEK